VSGFPNGDQSHSLGMPGTARKAITVAAYKTRNCWPIAGGEKCYDTQTSDGQAQVGDRAPFSSEGPTRDGREKPDVIAPGMNIVSVHSKDHSVESDRLTPDNKYEAMEGTSMATPLTCGIVALMLEKNGALTADTIRSILRNTARSDGFTGVTWNRVFGSGKVDAEAAIAAVSGGCSGPVNGDIDGNASTNVLDVIRLVNYILDPTGHNLTTEQRCRADVHPPGAADGTLNASDIARIVAFILETDTPGTPVLADGPALTEIGVPYREGAKWWVPVRISGEAVAACQFALCLEEARWDANGVRLEPAGDVRVVGLAVGSEARILLYSLSNRFPEDGITVLIPFACEEGGPSIPSLNGLLVADPHGFARETEVNGDDSRMPSARFLQVFPNPTKSALAIEYHLSEPEEVYLVVYDVAGRQVQVLEQGTKTQGLHSATWDGLGSDGDAVSPGVYLCRLLTPTHSITRKVLVSR
jgi:hypothetical protein